MKRIIYENQDGTVAVLIPAPDCLAMLEAQAGSIEAALTLIAEKDVPHGLPYWIVDTEAIPTDRTDRYQWRLDGSQGEPDGYGGESNEFPLGVVIPVITPIEQLSAIVGAAEIVATGGTVGTYPPPPEVLP